ncbi:MULTISPECIES: isocitrate lyase/phosphoenolpyruvate mutase family protein [unclassified Streptomyces]|uniref:isocitrate lyase/PEP mutase family protein n=1 Tax=unclassified Streptomyces TaxID=2593676 RepID=UPI0006FA2CB9|nr:MULTISPECIES: isocitrate lyase/phosphoenolpyruvate mutase family protein [unclassified Streptomyces]KQX59062.1 carboxyvinyl-carboxyphosphonate phosphorylmutase [Streptomyces sp. Root1304]KRB00324.1 carboxyvinyl-carboxyphosphonate phosphorylmutase [Streptomyces sp. Root66D1]
MSGTATGTGEGRAAVLRALHRDRPAEDPLVLPGPWDAVSARAFEAAGFPALATPSAGIAVALGHEDGATPAAEMFAAVARIVRAVSVPVTADLEGGYGLAPDELVERVRESGAVGVNLEDTGPDGRLRDPRAHADWLAEVRAAAGPGLFLNARVDTYIRRAPEPAADALARALLYAGAGADCVYPIAAPPGDLPPLRAALGDLPLNVLALPGGPSFAELGRLGASRVTFGDGLLVRAARDLADLAAKVRDGGAL